MSRPIYLDYNATTPVHPEVLTATTEALCEAWGNASSTHVYGREARARLEAAREQVAALIGATAEGLIFTGGGTESDNAAIVGVAEASERRGRHIVTTNVEHAAVEKACRRLEQRGWAVSRVPVDSDGRVDAEDVAHAMRDDTVLVSVMHGQNETGVLQPVAEIGRTARARGIPFHCDAAQSVGKLPVDVESFGCDLLTIAGHKLYAPKGIGALWVREGVPFRAVQLGAGHERGRRAGTENVAGAVGLGVACRLAAEKLPEIATRLASQRDRLAGGIREHVPDAIVHGEAVERLPNTLSIALPGTLGVEIVEALQHEVAMGAGAACHSGKAHVSGALDAMGVPAELALATLRLCVGSPTTDEEVERAAGAIGSRAARERQRV